MVVRIKSHYLQMLAFDNFASNLFLEAQGISWQNKPNNKLQVYATYLRGWTVNTDEQSSNICIKLFTIAFVTRKKISFRTEFTKLPETLKTATYLLERSQLKNCRERTQKGTCKLWSSHAWRNWRISPERVAANLEQSKHLDTSL